MQVTFKKVSRLKDVYFPAPKRATKDSAGYDLYVAQDITIPSFFQNFEGNSAQYLLNTDHPRTLAEVKNAIPTSLKPTLVSFGVKVYLPSGYYLKIVPRSSTPLKYLLLLANGEGIIDADYADNPSNEGEIFGQFINFSPYPISLKAGDCIAQGIVQKYYIDDEDATDTERSGGFGSTNA